MKETTKLVNEVFYMERRFNGLKCFWKIQMRKMSTVVTAGRVGFPGRVYVPRKHQSTLDTIKFVRKQIKQKRKNRYVLKRKVNKKTVGQKRAKKETKLTTNAKSPSKRRAPVETREDTASKSTEKKRKLEKNHSLESAVKYTLQKKASLTVGSSPYVPPQTEWPLNITAQVPWFYQSKSTSYGIYVDDNHCIFGNDGGQILDFSPSGKLQKQYQLPDGVRCIKKDGEFLYAGCNNGGLYDLTHGEPRLMCKIESFSRILWMDVHHGMICASDSTGNIALVNYEGEVIWKHQTGGSGWMARIDGEAVYHGYGNGVNKYSVANGKVLWEKNIGYILFGVQTDHFIYVAQGCSIHKLDKTSGKTIRVYDCGSVCPSNEVADGLVFGPSSNGIVCFDDKTGKIIYNLEKQSMIDQGAPMSMHYHRGRLYCVASQFYVVDLTAEAIKQAKSGKQLKSTTLVVDAGVAVVQPLTRVESISRTDAATEGVIVHCIKEGGKLRVRPLSSGYHSNWNCQFPREIRREGARYCVERLIIAPGKFYRAFGSIKQIES